MQHKEQAQMKGGMLDTGIIAPLAAGWLPHAGAISPWCPNKKKGFRHSKELTRLLLVTHTHVTQTRFGAHGQPA
jgi:hypothetical protein